jgi:hypothetical protein
MGGDKLSDPSSILKPQKKSSASYIGFVVRTSPAVLSM